MDLLNQEIIGRATYSEIIEGASILALDENQRKKEEQELNRNLPEGLSVTIDQFGIAHILSPLYVSSQI